MILKEVVSTGNKVDRVQVFLALILVGVVGFLCIGLYWILLDDNPPAEVFNTSLYSGENDGRVHKLEVQAGSDFVYGLDYCKYTSSPANIRTTWVDDLVYQEIVETLEPAVVPQGCGHLHILKTIPTTLLPAEYSMRVTLEYNVNFLKYRYVTYEVGKIIVVEGE